MFKLVLINIVYYNYVIDNTNVFKSLPPNIFLKYLPKFITIIYKLYKYIVYSINRELAK